MSEETNKRPPRHALTYAEVIELSRDMEKHREALESRTFRSWTAVAAFLKKQGAEASCLKRRLTRSNVQSVAEGAKINVTIKGSASRRGGDRDIKAILEPVVKRLDSLEASIRGVEEFLTGYGFTLSPDSKDQPAQQPGPR